MKTMRTATNEDYWTLRSFLEQANISTARLEEKIENFILLEKEDGAICGTIGIEAYGDAGLLRSLVIGPSIKQFQLLQLFEHTQQHAKKQNLKKLYLITNKTNYIQFFELLNFYPQSLEAAPQEMRHSDFFKEIVGKQKECTLMKCELVKNLVY
ncbi:N-acetylglutamate synthase [Bacillus sp. THAF10]|uniref:GNAT family N-acetyltransferase n=1 Tax=Bacillus sp. THAF10 TaxID=2587848 RepID=UPI0012695A24|nr:hypothetical protein [Bacillus sp. THAF10]QFT90944.1 N-acetylglutamate synthase [Bacillus sp. THAF10]